MRTIKKTTYGAIILMIIFIILIGLCSCSNDNVLQSGNYYLSSSTKDSYIEVLDKDTMILNNIDATELIESEIQMLEQFNGTITIPDSGNLKGKEIIVNDALPEEIEEYINLRKTSFVGEKKYRIVDSGDIHELYFDKETISIGEFVPASNAIKLSGKLYILE
jgi:hypothetical protein